MEWQEIHSKESIKMSKREIKGAPETLHMRRVDVCIKAHPERIA